MYIYMYIYVHVYIYIYITEVIKKYIDFSGNNAKF